MNKRIFVVALLITVGMLILLFLNEVSAGNLPPDIPVIKGRIISTSTFRSDELHRGISVVVETSLPLPEVARYYTDEFKKRDIRAFGFPVFQGNSPELQNSSEASGGGETSSHQQVMVYLQSESQHTIVTINVLGNSIFFLPHE